MIIRTIIWSIEKERIVEDHTVSANPIYNKRNTGYWYSERYNLIDQTKEIMLSVNYDYECDEEREIGYTLCTQNDIRKTLKSIVSTTIQKDIKSLRMLLEGLNASINKEFNK